MPTRPALTTRQETTTQVTSDNFNKGTELTFAEADSNFLNLRDGTFGVVGDDSSGVDIRDGQTLTVTGTGGITVAVANDTVTIDGSGVSGGANIGNLQVNDTTLSPITTNDDLILEANGTGTVSVYDNLYVTSEGRTGAQLGDLLRVQPAGASGVTINHEGTYQGTIFEVAGSQGQDASYRRPFYIVAENGNGTGGSPGNTDGRVYLNGIKFPLGPGTNGQVLTTNGTDEYSWGDIGSAIDPITFVGDDSTGTAVNTGETFKFAGTQNITTAVSGDTLTITGPDLTSFITASSTDTLTNKSGNISQWTNDSSYLLNVSEDTTPQLGGNLDVNGNSIVSTSAGDIAITPDTTGKIVLDGLNWPTADGTANQILKTDGLGNLSFASSTGIGAVVDDTTPQLGGDLDLNGNAIEDLGGTGDVTIKDNIRLDRGGGATIATQNGQTLKLQAGLATPAYIQLETSTPKDIKMNFVASGRLDFLDPNSTLTSTTIGSNGAASALTANPVGYLKIKIAGTEYQIPYYNT